MGVGEVREGEQFSYQENFTRMSPRDLKNKSNQHATVRMTV